MATKENNYPQLTEQLFDSIAELMDDEIREWVHITYAPCSPGEFLTEYLKKDPNFPIKDFKTSEGTEQAILPFIDATCKGELAISAFEKFIDALVEFRSWYILNPEVAHNIRPEIYQMLLDARSEISTTIGTVARYLPTTQSA